MTNNGNRFSDWLLVACGALLVLAAVPLPQTVSILCFWSAGLLLVWSCARRADPDLFLRRVILAGYLTVSGLAVFLYEASALRLPVLRGVQLGGGFWNFAPDAAYYHHWAFVATNAVRIGLPVPHFEGSTDFPYFIVFVYRLFGIQPLYPVVINVALVSLSAILGYLLARELSDNKSARVTAALIAFWPSLVIWSTQILKECWIIFFALAFFSAFQRYQRGPVLRRLLWGITCAITVFFLYHLRFYLTASLLIAVFVVCTTKGIRSLFRHSGGEAAAQVSLLIALGLMFVFSSSLRARDGGIAEMPSIYRSVAAHLESRGDIEGAADVRKSLEEALALRPPLGTVAKGKIARRTAAAKGNTPRRKEGTAKGAISKKDDILQVTNPVGVWSYLLRIPTLNSARRGFFRSKGAGSAVDKRVFFRNAGSMVAYLPKALLNATLTPNPFTRFVSPGVTGKLRSVSMVEVALICVLLLTVILRFPVVFRVAPELTALLALYSLIFATVLGLAVPVVGALFRLRLGFIIPLCVLAGIPHLRDPGRSGVARFLRGKGRSPTGR